MITLTYGVLPSREDFDAAFERLGGGLFRFGNDPRVGTCLLTIDGLWRELARAQAAWARGDQCCCPGEVIEGTEVHSHGCDGPEDAGQWCSDVLGILGFEWV